jgi:hypothetical protein
MERRKHMNTPKPASKKQKTSAKVGPSSIVVSNTNGDVDDGQPSQNALERPSGRRKRSRDYSNVQHWKQ